MTMFTQNTINFLDTDSYKVSQHKQLPTDAEYAMAYIEARGGADRVKFFGLQYILQQLQIPSPHDVEQASEFCKAHFGRDDVFDYKGWMEIANKGYYPLKIRAVAEGGIYPVSVPLITVENTEPGYAWLVTWFETQILRVWYPTNVATFSYEIKQLISEFLELNGTPESIGFKLHDFGSRGASSAESAGIGGMGHLLNFLGTDTLQAYMYAHEYYNATTESLAFSIPASEHSTITSWGKDFEVNAYRSMIEKFGKPGALYACVSDSYDLWEALKLWKQLEPMILEKGGTLVVRPDSGDPVETPIKAVKELITLFGSTTNAKGFKVLPDHIRVIQGDGIQYDSIRQILVGLHAEGISADNIAFGMGGALLQKHDRDTFKFAYKMCSITRNGKEQDVFKDPVTDPGKRSKAGRITTIVDDDGNIVYTRIPKYHNDSSTYGDLMITVWENSQLKRYHDFEEIRFK